MLTPAVAERLIQEHLPDLPAVSLPLSNCAGAVLRENIDAERDQPPFDRVAMDGIAVDSNAWRQGRRCFQILGIQAAGEPQRTLSSADGCLEVMTGAVLPRGCDCVVPVEHLQLQNGQAQLISPESLKPGQNVVRRGSEGAQGERLLSAGSVLRAPEIAVAAAAGKARINVSAQPSVMVISTGDELIEPGESILDHQIRRSNAHGVVAALRQRGFTTVSDDHLADDPQRLRERLRLHLGSHQVLIMSGGVSRGRYDFVPEVLQQLGVRQVFHRIAQRPGKPMWFGAMAGGPVVFALPGNPVATLVCVFRYVLPAFQWAMGLRTSPAETVVLSEEFSFHAPLSHFLPIVIERDAQGRSWGVPRPTRGSGDFSTLVGTDGFVELPPGPGSWPQGFAVPLYRW